MASKTQDQNDQELVGDRSRHERNTRTSRDASRDMDLGPAQTPRNPRAVLTSMRQAFAPTQDSASNASRSSSSRQAAALQAQAQAHSKLEMARMGGEAHAAAAAGRNADTRVYSQVPYPDREARVSGHTYGKVIARDSALFLRGNVVNPRLPPRLNGHEYTMVDVKDKPVGYSANVGAATADGMKAFWDWPQWASPTQAREDAQTQIASNIGTPEDESGSSLGQADRRGFENVQARTWSDLRNAPKRTSIKVAEQGRRSDRRAGPKTHLPDPESCIVGIPDTPRTLSPTPRLQDAYGANRSATNTASHSSNSLSTAGTFVSHTSMVIMTIIALVVSFLSYQYGKVSARLGDQALKLSMWEDCIEHTDILANSTTCQKLLQQGFDEIVRGPKPR